MFNSRTLGNHFLRMRYKVLLIACFIAFQSCGNFEAENSNQSNVVALDKAGFMFSPYAQEHFGAHVDLVFYTDIRFFKKEVKNIYWDHLLNSNEYCVQTSMKINKWSVAINCENVGPLKLYLIVEFMDGSEIIQSADITIISNALPLPKNPNVLPPLSGKSLYQMHCAGCHQDISTTNKPNHSVTSISGAIARNIGGMGSLASLTPDEIAAIARALVR